MLTLVDASNRATHAALLRSMHVDRKRIFVDMLRWNLAHDGEAESDRFDDGDAEYLVLQSSEGLHLGSVRLLRTDRPHLLGDVFPFLCDGEVPRGRDVREITRLCVAPSCPSDRRVNVTRTLCTALVEYALLQGIGTYTAITDVAFLARVLAAGWDCRPLGLPRSVDGAQLAALRIDVDGGTPARLRKAGRYEPVPMSFAAGTAS